MSIRSTHFLIAKRTAQAQTEIDDLCDVSNLSHSCSSSSSCAKRNLNHSLLNVAEPEIMRISCP